MRILHLKALYQLCLLHTFPVSYAKSRMLRPLPQKVTIVCHFGERVGGETFFAVNSEVSRKDVYALLTMSCISHSLGDLSCVRD